MSVPTSIRLEKGIEKQVEQYLTKNASLKFPQLVNMALKQFMSEPRTITLEPAATDEVMATAKQAFKKHKDAMDRLK